MTLSGANEMTEVLSELPPIQTESLSAAPRLGRYRLIACLGRGGMGDIFLALAQGLASFQKLVVVKQLRPVLAADAEYLAMFLDEARLAARFCHPNIVQTNEVGLDAGNRYFIAMEHLDGQPYYRVLRRAHALGGLPLPLQLHVLRSILEALQYAHTLKTYDGADLGFVHRDISPQNVFITYQGECKVLDFGVAKAVGSTVQTRPGTYKGKIGYMAPEQMQGDAVDRRADLFAVGVMLWTALAGRSPWHGMVNVEIGRRLLAGDIPSVRGAGRPVDEVLASICERAMAPAAADRYESAHEMRTDLDAYLESQGLWVDRQDLSGVLQKLFAVDRVRMQRFIEEQIRRAGAPALSDGAEVALPVVEPPGPAYELKLDLGPRGLWTPRERSSGASAIRGSRAWGRVCAVAQSTLAAAAELLEVARARVAPFAANHSWKRIGAVALAVLIAAVAALQLLGGGPASRKSKAPTVVRIPAIELKPFAGSDDEEAPEPPAPPIRNYLELAPSLTRSVRGAAPRH